MDSLFNSSHHRYYFSNNVNGGVFWVDFYDRIEEQKYLEREEIRKQLEEQEKLAEEIKQLRRDNWRIALKGQKKRLGDFLQHIAILQHIDGFELENRIHLTEEMREFLPDKMKKWLDSEFRYYKGLIRNLRAKYKIASGVSDMMTKDFVKSVFKIESLQQMLETVQREKQSVVNLLELKLKNLEWTSRELVTKFSYKLEKREKAYHELNKMWLFSYNKREEHLKRIKELEENLIEAEENKKLILKQFDEYVDKVEGDIHKVAKRNEICELIIKRTKIGQEWFTVFTDEMDKMMDKWEGMSVFSFIKYKIKRWWNGRNKTKKVSK